MSLNWRVLHGDVREQLQQLAPQSVQCVCTSPPYWGLRDYGHAGQIGLESTPDAYVAALVSVFRDVRTVLKDDGVVWLNLGDSYANDTKWGGSSGGKHVTALHGQTGIGRNRVSTGLKPKDLVGIPWRVAFALQADGWYLRSDIIWSKPNPMPESVQGSHYSRHLVTIDEYERLSGLRYVDERAGDAWAGDMPSLSESKAVSCKAPLSAEREGYCDCQSARREARRSGKTQAVQPIAVRPAKQGEVRIDREGQAHQGEGTRQIQGVTEGATEFSAAASADQGYSNQAGPAQEGKQRLSQDGQGQSAGLASECPTSWSGHLDFDPTQGVRMGRDRSTPSVALPLLPPENEADDRPCDPTQQGGATHQGERGAGVRTVQFKETGPDGESLLVGCPGCQKCIQHHGYIFHLSAGRPTKAHEYIFLLTKQERYFYDSEAITEPLALTSSRLNGLRPSEKVGGFYHPGHYGESGAQHGREMHWKPEDGRNKRSVWHVATQPYPDAHFATYPEKLIEPCILAGSALGDTVLDPFCGSGTTGAVAIKHGRNFVGIELNAEYVQLSRRRIGSAAPLFAEEMSA